MSSEISHGTSWTRGLDIAAASTGTAGLMFIAWRIRRRIARIPTADHITPEMIASKRILKGKCVKVNDADGLRMYHTPFPAFLRKPPKLNERGLGNRTIAIRLAGVDAPEMAHFGNPKMPYSDEAFDYLRSLVENRTVRAQLLRKDQYGRVVALVTVRKFPWIFKTSVSYALASAGLATLYTSAGAVYGTEENRQRLEKAVETAKMARKGMWGQAASVYESPAEYKQRVKSEGSVHSS